MGFFDFLAYSKRCAAEPQSVDRLNLQYQMIVEPLLPLFEGRSVLEIGAKDGRWAYAFAKAGAAYVIALEENSALVQTFQSFPKDTARARVQMKCVDIFEHLEHKISLGQRLDIVAIMGSFHCITDHMRLLRLLRRLEPKVVIIDDALALSADQAIKLCDSEKAEEMDILRSESAAQNSLTRLPSQTALKAMAQNVGYQCDWIDWDKLAPDDRQHVPDYFRVDGSRRFTCLMHTL